MIQDLKADSANFERSGDTGSPFPDGFGQSSSSSPNISLGRYENSMVHRSRQHWGPTAEQSQPEERPPRADSESTQYTQRTASSYQSGQSYGSSQQSYGGSQQPYGHDSRPARELEPQRHQPMPRDPYQPYGGGQPAGYPPVGSAVSTGENYTHHAAVRQPAVNAPYGYPAQGYDRTASEYAQPRSTTHQSAYPSNQPTQNSAYSTGSHGAHTSRYFGTALPEYLVYH
jgi:hypothetical protein